MIIFPAIDIQDGQCVRLTQGKFDQRTVYYKDPVEVAKMWQEKGAQYLHVVDLDGAKDGVPKNIKVIEEIVKNLDIPVQVGGGIRTKDTIEKLLNIGVQRIILGTAAVSNPLFLSEVIKTYKEKIVISIDAKDGLVATNGWIEISSVQSFKLIEALEKIGVSTIVYTDISKDGMMQGPNFEIYQQLMEKCSVSIIASGGVSNLEDLKRLNEIGVYGAIVGKALYSGAVKFEETLDKI